MSKSSGQDKAGDSREKDIEIKGEGEAATAVKVALPLNSFTNVILKEANLVVIAFPISTPKWTALGFLHTVLDEFTAFYNALEAKAQQNAKGGIVKASMADALALGKSLLKS